MSGIYNIKNIFSIFILICFIAPYGIAQPLDIRLAKVYIGENAGDKFSSGIGAAGDINGDGYNDFLIGARWWGPDDHHYGRAYVYLGGDTLPDEPALVLGNGSTEQSFGYALHGVGDLNSDGYDDYGIFSTGLGDAMGALSIFFGGDTLSSQPYKVLRGSLAVQNFGISFSGGDLNNDGYGDLIVGAPFGGPVGQLGRVYVYFGSDSFDTDEDWVTYGVDEYFRYGRTVLTGDLNGDGIDDLVIGDVNTDSDSGNIHIFFGGDSFDTVEDVTIVSSKGSIGFIVMIGNLNGDTADDILVWDFSSTSHKIYFGGVDFDSIPDDEIKTDELCGDIGHFDRDNFEDLIIGHPIRNKIRIFRGNTLFDLTSDFSFQLGGFSTSFGCAKSLGDINGDGAGDFIVADPLGGDVTPPEGLAYLFLGDTSTIVSVKDEPKILPSSFLTLRAYPNPFNPVTTIAYSVPGRSRVQLSVYNIRGETILSLVDSVQNEGRYEIRFDGTHLSSGIYFVRMAVAGNSKTIKLLLLK